MHPEDKFYLKIDDTSHTLLAETNPVTPYGDIVDGTWHHICAAGK